MLTTSPCLPKYRNRHTLLAYASYTTRCAYGRLYVCVTRYSVDVWRLRVCVPSRDQLSLAYPPLFTRGLPRTSWAAAVASVVTGDLAATETP